MDTKTSSRATQAFDIDPSVMTLSIGGTAQRQATGGTLPYKYSAGVAAIATVDASSGPVTANAAGITSITITDAAAGAKSYPVVVEPPLFYIDPSTVTFSIGGSAQRQATGGKPPYSYSAADTAIASVDASTGTVTAMAAGTTSVTARDTASGETSYPVVVQENFYIDPSQVNLGHAQVYSRNAVGGTPPYAYMTSDPNVVVVLDAAKGDIRAMENGSATIIAYDAASHQGSYVVNVGPVVIEETFDGYLDTLLTEDGASMTLRTMTVTKVSGYSVRIARNPGGYLDVTPGARFAVASLQLNTPCRRAEFALFDVSMLTSFVIFFDSNGSPLGTVHAAPVGNDRKWAIDFSAEDISRIEIHVQDVVTAFDMRFHL